MDELTTSQAAERLNVGASTVRLWCQQGRFPNARAEQTPRGVVWLIPRKDLDDFDKPKRGRVPKASLQATANATRGNGPATAAPKPKSGGGQDGKVIVTKRGGEK